MPIRLEHTGNATPTTLTSAITSAATTLNVAVATGWPTGTVGPFVATLDRGTASEEKILVLSRTGTVLTVQTRGYDGTAQTAHGSTATVEHTFSATEADEANATAVALGTLPPSATLVTTTGVQTLTNKTLTAPVVTGAAGSVVTTGATQTLTAKTLTSPVINTPTGDVATLTGAQTLTNKTLTAPAATGSLTGFGGAWTAYTPTWTSSTGAVNAGTGGILTGKYSQVGKTVTARITVVLGSSVAGWWGSSGQDWRFSVPVAPANPGTEILAIGSGVLYDADSAGYYPVAAVMAFSLATFYLAYANNSGHFPLGNAFFPFAGAVGDSMSATVTYEAA